VVFEGGEPVHEWSQLLCPEDVDWNSTDVQRALEVNRIDRRDLLGKPTFRDVLPDLVLELSQPVWVAHNADFDMRMLRQELQRLGQPLQEPELLICTKNLAAKLNTGSGGNRLEEVATRYNVSIDLAHRAVADAKTCGRVLNAMLRHGGVPQEDNAMKELCKQAAVAWRGKRRY
jgi:hypothetical protein